MANPQLEDGHLRIANDIWDALCRIRIPGEVRQVIDTVLRKTWGFRKKQDWISLSQFHEATGIHKPNISRALTQAITMNIILKKENTVLNNENAPAVSYSFNKDYETWKPLSKKRTFSIKRKAVLNNEKKSSQKRGTQHTTDILKDNTAPSAPISQKTKKKTDPRIKLLIDYWFQDYGRVFPGEKYVVQGGKDAAAVKRLLGTAPLEDMQAAASWFLRLESNDWLGQLGKEISLFVMKYNEIRQRMLAEKGRYERPPG